MKHTLKILFVYCVLLSIFLTNDYLVVKAATLPKFLTTEAKVTISASLGEPILKLWGHGPVSSRVELNGSGVSDFTYTRTDGYFEFSKSYLPNPVGFFYPELCLTAIDQVGRATPPTCIPALPATSVNYNVGPVILPPTISLEGESASGTTLPGAEVKIVLAESENGFGLSKFNIVGLAKAYYIPDYTIQSDFQGNFSFNMPKETSKTWRVFAITTYSQGATSPKSNTLNFSTASAFITAITNLWKFLMSLLTLPRLIILEIVVILAILTIIFLKKKKHQTVPLKEI